MLRKCVICNAMIKECMGFVLARDIVDKRNPIREICGKCGLIVLDMDEIQLKGKMAEWLKAAGC